VSASAKPRLASRVAIGTERCRCGTPLSPGSPAYTLEGVPDLVASLVLGRTFCSVGCVRAFLLETMETFESAWIHSVVLDALAVTEALRLVYFYTATEREAFDTASPPARL